MSVTVYSNPTCNPCKMTKKALQARGIEYTEVDLHANPDRIGDIIELGYRGVPVVVLENGDHWHGYAPERIEAI